jgi:diacylglycerol kinase (ATP)
MHMTSEHSPYKSKGGLGRLFNALRFSARGLNAALKHEAAFRQELVLAALLLPLGIWLATSVTLALLLAGSVILVLVVELLNSALEALADAITVKHHPLIGRAKDIGSAAVFLSLMFCAVTWLSVLGLRLLST